MMTLQILKSVDFTKTQKSRYLENKIFFLQVKRFINYTSRNGTFMAENTFVPEITFKDGTKIVFLLFKKIKVINFGLSEKYHGRTTFCKNHMSCKILVFKLLLKKVSRLKSS